jgi:hypothetical protein
MTVDRVDPGRPNAGLHRLGACDAESMRTGWAATRCDPAQAPLRPRACERLRNRTGDARFGEGAGRRTPRPVSRQRELCHVRRVALLASWSVLEVGGGPASRTPNGTPAALGRRAASRCVCACFRPKRSPRGLHTKRPRLGGSGTRRSPRPRYSFGCSYVKTNGPDAVVQAMVVPAGAMIGGRPEVSVGGGCRRR